MVLYFEQHTFLCGHLFNASRGIVRTKTGDTLRVLTYCDGKGMGKAPRLLYGDSAVIRASNGSGLPDYMPDPWACSLHRSAYGFLTKLERKTTH